MNTSSRKKALRLKARMRLAKAKKVKMKLPSIREAVTAGVFSLLLPLGLNVMLTEHLILLQGGRRSFKHQHDDGLFMHIYGDFAFAIGCLIVIFGIVILLFMWVWMHHKNKFYGQSRFLEWVVAFLYLAFCAGLLSHSYLMSVYLLSAYVVAFILYATKKHKSQ